MITPQQRNQSAAAQKTFCLIVHPPVKVRAALIYILESFSHELILFHLLASRDVVNIELRLLAQVITFHQKFFIDFTQIKPLFPSFRILSIKNVDLGAGSTNMI